MNTNPLPRASAPLSTPPPSAPGRRPKLKLALLGTLGVLLVALLAGAAWLLHLIWWTVPFLQETALLAWIAATALALAVTAVLAGLKFRQAWLRSPTRTASVWAMLVVSIALGAWLGRHGYVAMQDFLPRVVKLDLPSLPGPIPTHYDHGAKARAERLQADIREMNAFYQEKLGVQVAVHLAVLNSNQWTRVNPIPFGLPGIAGEPPVVFAPAHSGGFAFRLMLARKDGIPAEDLRDYLRTSQRTYEAVADDLVDLIALHELGHALLVNYGIDPGCHWLNEFLARWKDWKPSRPDFGTGPRDFTSEPKTQMI